MRYLLITLIILFFTGCGGGGSSSSSSNLFSGKFIDSEVSGLKYTCSSGRSGVTNTSGTFTCQVGDTVTFYLNDYTLGTVETNKPVVTPIDLYPVLEDDTPTQANKKYEKAIALAMVLQNVNSNASADDGIVLNKSDLEKLDLNDIFSKDTLDEVETQLTTSLPERTIISKEDATAHITKSLAKEDIQSTVGKAILDPFFKYAWHIENKNNAYENDNNISQNASANIKKAWALTKGVGSVIAVIDDSFNSSHEDLRDNVIATYDAITKTTKSLDEDFLNDNGFGAHGTAVAGIAAASANSKGVIGVAPDAKLILIAIGANENTDSQIIDAFDFAMKNGANVVSCSWGTFNVSSAVNAKIKELYDNNITVVFATGNNGYNLDEVHPDDGSVINDESELPWVIGVGSSTEAALKKSTSNYGKRVDILAPSGENVGIVTTDEMGTDGLNSGNEDFVNANYTFFNGTSASTPIVAGVAALLYSADNSLTPAQIREVLITTADKIGDVSYNDRGWNDEYAYGKVNAYAALRNILNISDDIVIDEEEELVDADPNREIDISYRGTWDVSGSFPANNATGVDVNVHPTMTGNGDTMSCNDVTSSNTILQVNTGSWVNSGISLGCSASGSTITSIPATALDANTQYRMRYTTNLTDTKGDQLGANTNRVFTTGAPADSVPPTVSGVTPTNGSTDVAANSNITVTFDEAMDSSTLTNSNITLSCGGSQAGSVSDDGTTATFNPTSDMPYSTSCTVTVSTGVTDAASNALASQYQFSFTTEAAPDLTAPTISSNTPTDGSSNIAIASNMTVTFDEAMDAGTINNTNITLSTGGGAPTWSDPESGLTLLKSYVNGEAVNDVNDGITRSGNAFWAIDATVPASPSGALMEHGGTGTGSFIGFVSGNFIARMGAGGTGNPAGAALISVSESTLVNKTGTFFVDFKVSTNTVTAWFQENSTGEATLIGTNTDSGISNWTGTNDGFIGNDNGNLAGSYSVAAYNGSITQARLYANGQSAPSPFQTSSGGGTPVSGAVTLSGNTATFNPDANLANSTLHTLTVSTSVTDTSGNALATEFTSDFTTASADAIAPTVTGNTPTNGATEIAVTDNMTVTFSEAMDAATINNTNITLYNDTDSVGVAGAVTLSGNTATFNPTSNLLMGKDYTLTTSTSVTDEAGNNLGSPHTFSFTTTMPETVPPVVSSVTPTDTLTNVLVGSNITVTFNETMDSSTLTNSNITVSGGVTGTVTDDGTTATFNPTSNLAYSTTYTVTVSTNVTDLAGNNLAAQYQFSFTTEDAETVPPTISTINPSDTATDISSSSAITITFSENMKASSITGANIYLEDAGFALVSSALALNNNIVTLTPDSALNISETYTLTITTGVQDLVGNALASSSVTTFTTSASTCTQTANPTICYSVPADGSSNVLEDATIKIRFSEIMTAGSINGTNITVRDGAAALVSGTVTRSSEGYTATFEPDSDLTELDTYTVYVAGATTGSETSNTFGSQTSFSFTVSSGEDGRDGVNEYVQLPNSGLTWLDDSSVDTKRTWSQAQTFCEGLSKGAYSDWRLPNINELKALAKIISLDDDLFVNERDGYFWTSQVYSSDTTRAYDVRLNSGTVGNYAKTNENYVRCVRSDLVSETGQDTSSANTVTMNSSGLVWQNDTAVTTNTQDWATAGSYCSSLSLDGSTNWRLPSISELETIVDTQVDNSPYINVLFTNTAENGYWSSTPRDVPAAYVGTAWEAMFLQDAQYVDFYTGQTQTNAKTYSGYNVRCVRNK